MIPSVTIIDGVVRVNGCSETTCLDHGAIITRVREAIVKARAQGYECGWTDGFTAGAAL